MGTIQFMIDKYDPYGIIWRHASNNEWSEWKRCNSPTDGQACKGELVPTDIGLIDYHGRLYLWAN